MKLLPASILALALAPSAHRLYASDDTMLDLEEQVYQSIPERFHTQQDDCRHHDRAMVRALSARRLDDALALGRTSSAACGVISDINLLSALVQGGRFAQARPIADRLVGERLGAVEARNRGPLFHLAGITMLRTGEVEEADALFRRAEKAGLTNCALARDRANAASLLELPEAEALVARASACRGR